MDYTQAVAWLDSHTNFEGSKHGPASALPNAGATDELSLDAMRELMAALGDPHTAYRSFHLTGTNGKGSTARFISSIVADLGLSVGLYTSPNLEKVNERIVWDGRQIPDEDLAAVLTLISEIVPTLVHKPTRFELLTAAAFTWFAEQGAEIAVVEVGLLGRFDATNVIDGDVVVITNIGKDHTDGAAGWESAVTSEKAGIIKPDSAVVLGAPFSPELRAIVDLETSRQVWEAGDHFAVTDDQLAVGGHAVSVRTPTIDYSQIFIPLHGAYQPHNFATALVAVEAFFGRAVDDDIVRAAVERLELPGRFEVMRNNPTVILEGAHNPPGARAAKYTLDNEFARFGSWILVTGFLTGKDPAEMLEALGADDFDAVIICEPTWSRAIPAAEAAEAARAMGLSVEVIPSPAEAYRRALAVAAAEDLIMVTGSLYVVGEIRPTVFSANTAID